MPRDSERRQIRSSYEDYIFYKTAPSNNGNSTDVSKNT